jgi:ankyrin repeat protein
MKSKTSRKQRSKPQLRCRGTLGNTHAHGQASSCTSTATEPAGALESDGSPWPDQKSADAKAVARRAKLLADAQTREAKIRLLRLVDPPLEQPKQRQPAANEDTTTSSEASLIACAPAPARKLQSAAATAAAARRSRLQRDAAAREAKILGSSAVDVPTPVHAVTSFTLASDLDTMPQLEVCTNAAQLRRAALKSTVEMRTSRGHSAVAAAAADSQDDAVSPEQVLLDIWYAKDCAGSLQQHLTAHDINSHYDDNERTLLRTACCNIVSDVTGSSDTLVRLLLKAGADANAVTTQGITPLMTTKSAEVVHCLLEHGANLFAVSDCGFTAMSLASTAGLTECVKVMLKRPGAAELIVKQSPTELAPLGLTPLALALNNGHERTAMLLLKHALQLTSFSVNAPMAGSVCPLLISAVCAEMQQLVTLLLDSGAAVDILDSEGKCAVLWAVAAGNLSLLNLLHARGANMHVHSKREGNSAMRQAALGGHTHIIRRLLQLGVAVNVPEQCSPYIYSAVARGEVAAVQTLLHAGATLPHEVQQLTLLLCLDSKQSDAVAGKLLRLLLPHCSRASIDTTELFRHAVGEQKEQAVRALLAAGADVQCIDELGYTALHTAAGGGDLALVQLLVSAGIDPRVRSSDSVTALHSACSAGQLAVAKCLLRLPAVADDINLYAGWSDLTALLQDSAYSALKQRYDAMIKALLAAGADVHAVHSDTGRTVLHNHAEAGTSGTAVCTLLKAGADPTALDANGSTAAHIAGMSGHFALEALLSRAAEDYRKKLGSSAANADSGSKQQHK